MRWAVQLGGLAPSTTGTESASTESLEVLLGANLPSRTGVHEGGNGGGNGSNNRVFSIITWKLTVTPTGKCRKFWAGNAWPRRALPCLVQGSIFRIPPKASHAPKIYLNPISFNVAATFGCVPVRTVENPVSATGPPRAFYTTSAIWFPVGRTTSPLSTRNINAPSARSSSTPT